MQPILPQVSSSQHLGELTVREAAHVVQLPQAVLRHRVTEGGIAVGHRRRLDVGDPPLIAPDRCRRIHGYCRRALDREQFAAQVAALEIQHRSARHPQLDGGSIHIDRFLQQ
jgi:hypothetical protein